MAEKNYCFAILCLGIALFYAWLSYNLGPGVSIEGLKTGAVIYGPLLFSCFILAVKAHKFNLHSLFWVCIFLLMVGTIGMVIGGQNFVGLLIGIFNCLLSWVIGLGVLISLHNQKYLTHHSSGTPNGAL